MVDIDPGARAARPAGARLARPFHCVRDGGRAMARDPSGPAGGVRFWLRLAGRLVGGHRRSCGSGTALRRRKPGRVFASPLRIPAVYGGGLSDFGTALGEIAAAALYARGAHLPVASLLDVVSPGFLVEQVGASHRPRRDAANLVNGEHIGRLRTWPGRSSSCSGVLGEAQLGLVGHRSRGTAARPGRRAPRRRWR